MITQELLNLVTALAKQAGLAIMEVYNRGQAIKVQTKSDHSPVTEADLAAHNIIEQGLRELTPTIPVLSEESALAPYQERSNWTQYWLIDPLDGTKEFIRRSDEFTVNIALIRNNEPVLGVVYLPAQEVSYFAAQGIGAFKQQGTQQEAIATRSIQSIKDSQQELMVVASRHHGAEAVEQLLSRLEQKLTRCKTVNLGSSLKMCLIAEGKADIYPRLAPTSEWDTAAAQAILEMAGGMILADDFSPLRYNTKENILNPHFYAVGDNEIDWRTIIND